MDELVRWLGEQLNEDERTARAATLGPWVQSGIGEYGWTVDFGRPGAGVETEDSEQGLADADFIAAHNPARVLREIDVDRELLAEYERLLTAHDAHQREAARLAEQGDDDPTRHAALRREADYLPAMLHVLDRWAKRKAVVYADRPGYREEWRP
ncbi:DUF6221 family protein [Streptomyces naphthomycinicus]|uniref:DUF6221 family protein n=1 Tax=Streptomyces naphthomycinicus TaxID=2872625 RepID=UPI001CEC0C63|nr:DUF6221 family protein [Streptomyces sp. TML10]